MARSLCLTPKWGHFQFTPLSTPVANKLEPRLFRILSPLFACGHTARMVCRCGAVVGRVLRSGMGMHPRWLARTGASWRLQSRVMGKGGAEISNMLSQVLASQGVPSISTSSQPARTPARPAGNADHTSRWTPSGLDTAFVPFASDQRQ